MEKRPIIYGYEQARTFDYLSNIVYAMEGDSRVAYDLMGAVGTTVVSGGSASATSPSSLSINIAPVAIYQLGVVDGIAYGSLPANSTQIMQIGHNSTVTQLTFSTSALTSGQSMWALVEASWQTTDSVAPNDPNGGLLLYYNATNPSQPYQGQNNNGATQNTLRSNTVVLNIIYGAVASSGSEVPPTPSVGSVPLYLVDLTYGQANVTNIIKAGPSVGVNVPSNYPYAPFLAGLLNPHHSGQGGQAPQIQLATETQGNFNRIVQGVTPPIGDNSLNLATTNFVSSHIGGTAGVIGVTTTTVLTAAQAGLLVVFYGVNTGQTITLPPTSSLSVGQQFKVVNNGTQVVYISATGSDTIGIQTRLGGVSDTIIGLEPGDSLSIVVAASGAWDSYGTLSFYARAIGAVADVTSSRLFGSTYTNSASLPMYVTIYVFSVGTSVSMTLSVSINGSGYYFFSGGSDSGGAASCGGLFIVPAGATYNVTQVNAGKNTPNQWVEQV